MNAGDPGDGFLTRWSRRKREVLRDRAPASPPAVPPTEALPAEPAAAEEPDPVEPPSLELVDKDFDLAHWMKQNVPESWKLAALRRAWESDPAIRDFENPARDYALDWNTPGGAPGYGPLAESDDVEAMVRGIFGDPPPFPAENEPTTAKGDSVPHQLSSHDDSASELAAVRKQPEHGAQGQSADTPEGPALARAEDEKEPNSMKEAFDAARRTQSPPPPRRRRGGSATPA